MARSKVGHADPCGRVVGRAVGDPVSRSSYVVPAYGADRNADNVAVTDPGRSRVIQICGPTGGAMSAVVQPVSCSSRRRKRSSPSERLTAMASTAVVRIIRTSVGAVTVACALAGGVAVGATSPHVGPLSSASPPWPNIGRAGVSLPVTVRSLQHLLDAHGAKLPVDGQFGRSTARAVRSFQAAHGIPVTGRTTVPTWRALIVKVQQGSVGHAVMAVQDQANFRNLRGTGLLVVDGVYGPSTRAAVRRVQAAYGLRSDGVVDAATWRFLVSERSTG